MSQLNQAVKLAPVYTAEGARAMHITPVQQLRRLVMSCMLWEDNFYIDGVSVGEAITKAVHACTLAEAGAIAIEARTNMKLRHVPLLIVREMARHPRRHEHVNHYLERLDYYHTSWVSRTLAEVIQRPDELTEFLAIYWKDGKCPLSKQVKLGLAKAFAKFNEYQLAKYNRKKDIMLRDVLFLCHSKPADGQGNWTKQIRAAYKDAPMPFEPTPGELLYGKLIYDELETPDTWEVELSKGGPSKQTSWLRLLDENKLGDLAFLRNLRNMIQAGVNEIPLTHYGESRNWGRVLPFRFIAAANHAPSMKAALEHWMFKCLEGMPKLMGHTVLCIDVSGSMSDRLSAKSDLTRLEAAKALAMLLRELCEHVTIYRFDTKVERVSTERGFALSSAIGGTRGGTDIGLAVRTANAITHDRLIVLTDEQSMSVPSAPQAKGYMINVATNKNGIGYGPWMHIDGFSEAVVDYIQMYESEEA